MKTALIISGGDFCKFNNCLSYNYVICCDKGAFYAKDLKIKPDIIIGDFDSYTGDIFTDFPNTEILKYPKVKDDTDTMLAIKHAMSLHYEHIIITCALGSRMDHTIANIQSLNYISAHGGIGEIYSESEHIRTLSAKEGTITLEKKPGFSLSLFALSDECKGVTIKGAKYNVENITLINAFPLGHGNTFIDDKVTVSLSSGTLIIVESEITD